MGIKTNVSISVVGLVISIPLQYVTERTLVRWGGLDDFSDALGDYLKLHVSASDAALSASLMITLLAYSGLMWLVWHKRKASPEPDALPVAPALIENEGRAPSSDNQREIDALNAQIARMAPFIERVELQAKREKAEDIARVLRTTIIPKPNARWKSGYFHEPEVVRLGLFNRARDELGIDTDTIVQEVTSKIMGNAIYCTLQPDDADHFADPALKQTWHLANAKTEAVLEAMQKARLIT